MNKPSESLFTTRSTVVVELPMSKYAHVLHPERVILKIAEEYHDIGALCYTLRSDKNRKRGKSREVAISSLHKQRPKQIMQLIKALTNLITDDGQSLETIGAYVWIIKLFIDWADGNGLHDCLAGGETTRKVFRAWAAYTLERYHRQEINEGNHNFRLTVVCKLLERTTGLEDLMQGIRKVKRRYTPNGGTEPLAVHDFAHAVALNQCLFDGLCDLVLEQRPFPYKLVLPKSLGWAENHLWLFPTSMWRMAPHSRIDDIRAKMGSNASWAYDYENGRLATLDEIEHRYRGSSRRARRHSASGSIRRAMIQMGEANADPRHKWRQILGKAAQRAFLFLFFCNTGSNEQVVRDLETDGCLDATTQNQNFRGLKWRAGGKEVILVASASFMPRLRRYMELRRYLLQGKKTPYLFFRFGNNFSMPPARLLGGDLDNHYKNLLSEIDPQLPRMGPRTLRASVDDYYLRLHDSVVAAAIMGHTVETEQKKYGRGSANDHHEEMTIFMESVSESARRQRVISLQDVIPSITHLEEGGLCDAFGYPEALASHVPSRPDCKDSQGCLFCNNRVLVAGEEDARKVASAAYVMEQLVLGPKHEEALRPLIAKCDEDLEKMAAFPNCRSMIEKVQKDVYESENLTPFWADKYQFFLELGIIS